MARERERLGVQEKRKAFLEHQPQLEVRRLVFLDESGFRLGSSPRYGWAPKGAKAPGKHVQGKWETITMLGAVALDGLRGFMTIDAGTGNDVFSAFVEHELVPNLRSGDIVVMDNLSAHRNAAVLGQIHAAGAQTLFIPPYSPEFNPIEKLWGKLKDLIRRAETLTRAAFDRAVACALQHISLHDIRAWIQHAGYNLINPRAV